MRPRRSWSASFWPALALALAATGCGSAEELKDFLEKIGQGQGGSGGSGGAMVCGPGLAPCAAGQVCDFAAPSCGRNGPGVCRAKPQACDLIYAPVCGCDGKTYGNDCARLAAGVSKQHDGECRQVVEVGEGEQCAGFTPPPQRVCAKGLKCNPPPGRCDGIAADLPGICEAVPTVCTKEYRPVCGCDGKTYGNDCMRKAAGVGLNHPGECRSQPGGKEGEMCGGIAGFPCATGLFCEPPAGSCRVADVAGVCKRRPEACLAIYDPVCGCDGKTYGNDCTRMSAGVAKAHDGECASSAKLLTPGLWGGEHVLLTARDPKTGASIEFDCARGSIRGPLEVSASGEFKWAGTYTREGGPEPAGGRPGVDATYFGKVVNGRSMELTVALSGVQHMPLRLVLGQRGRLFKCQ